MFKSILNWFSTPPEEKIGLLTPLQSTVILDDVVIDNTGIRYRVLHRSPGEIVTIVSGGSVSWVYFIFQRAANNTWIDREDHQFYLADSHD